MARELLLPVLLAAAALAVSGCRSTTDEAAAAADAAESAPRPIRQWSREDLRAAAEAGGAEAQVELARRLESCDGGALDLAAAADWYRRAAEEGHAAAQHRLALMYEHGFAVEKDPARSREWMQRAAEQGHAAAAAALGRLYLGGSQEAGLAPDEDLALAWLRRADAHGDVAASRLLAARLGVELEPVLSTSGEDIFIYDRAGVVAGYQRAAELGVLHAEYVLGELYATGHLVPRDDAEAARHLALAAERELPAAQVALAYLRQTGRAPGGGGEGAETPWHQRGDEIGPALSNYCLGRAFAGGDFTVRNPAEARKWLRLAAEQEHLEAQSELAFMYGLGQGVARDPAEEAKWARRAAEQGDAVAQYSLGVSYRTGDHVEENPAEAAKWYRRAAEQGQRSAQDALADLYAEGEGVKRDDAEAAKWYRLAAEQGEMGSQLELGDFHRAGRGVPQDDAEALRWYRRAAAQGSTVAQARLGESYELGRGVERDLVAAYAWYLIGEANSGMVATDRRKQLAPKLSPPQIAQAQRIAAAWQETDEPDPDPPRDTTRASCFDEPIAMAVREAQLRDVLPAFAEVSKLRLEGAEGVTGSVSIQTAGAPWPDLLTQALRCNGYRWERDEEAIRILP